MILKCPLCDAEDHEVIFKDLPQYPGASIVKCSVCFHIYTLLNHSPGTEQLYSDPVYKVVENRKSIFDKILSRENKAIIKKINRLKQDKGNLLDFGCGKGKFAAMAQQSGWRVKCVETAPERADYAKKIYGLDVNSDYYTTGKLFSGNFDTITLFHVLEHLPAPLTLLRELIDQNLAKNGLLVLEVPNFKSVQSRIAGSRWMHLDAYRHVNHFTPPALDRIAGELKLKIQRTSSFSFHLGVLGMTDSFLKIFGYRKNIIFELKNKKKVSLLLAIAILLPFALVLEAFSAATGRGGITRKYLISGS